MMMARRLATWSGCSGNQYDRTGPFELAYLPE